MFAVLSCVRSIPPVINRLMVGRDRVVRRDVSWKLLVSFPVTRKNIVYTLL